jgi:hypothetical protein
MSISWKSPAVRRYLSLFAIYWVIALATHAEGLYQPMHNDLSVRLRVARDWRAGLKLYEETYENTQPTYFLFILLADSARPEITHYLAESLLATIAALSLYIAMRRTAPRCAMVAPVLLIAWSGIGGTFYGGQITEGVSIWFDVIAMCLCFEAVRKNCGVLALLSGVSFCLMLSIRIPCVLHAVAYAPLLWIVYRDYGIKRAMTMALLFTGGIILALATMLIHALSYGYLHAFLDMLARNFQYAAGSRTPLAVSLDRAWDTISGIIHANPAFLILMALTILVFLPKAFGPLRHERLWFWVSLLWLAAALASAFPGGRHFAHYYHVVWPPVSVLSVLWLSRLGLFTREPQLRRKIAWGLAIAFASMGIVLNVRGLVRETFREDPPRVAIQQAADYLNQITTPDQPVPVPVWGKWAELWWRVPRPPVSRCFAPQCFYVIQRDMFEEWVKTMIDQPPPLIVADESLIGPLSHNSPYDNTEFRPPAGHPLYHLRQLVDEDYVEIHRIEDLSFLARRNGPFDPHGK